MIRIILFAVVLFFFSTNGCAGYIGFPDDREEMYQWCVTIDPDQLESELTELSDEEREIRIGEETDFDQVQFVVILVYMLRFLFLKFDNLDVWQSMVQANLLRV